MFTQVWLRRKAKRRIVLLIWRFIFAISKNIDLRYSICVFEALIWLKFLTEKQQQFVNQKIFSIFVVGKQSEKVFEYQTKKRRSTRRKRKNYCFDLCRLKRKRIKNNR
ncbi:MAG: hypothetical protein MR891_06770 [Bacteroidales bacterium]|nr:hypothetical protein [Bacteroidales bacterium]